MLRLIFILSSLLITCLIMLDGARAEMASPEDEQKLEAEEKAEEAVSLTPTKKSEPFAFADFTWLNGNSRQKKTVLDTPYFTGQFLADVNYIYSLNQPKDHTLLGSSTSGRTNEIQVQQLGVGGDFHYGHARGRFMTQFGLYSAMTPRNDASVTRGQWDIGSANRYVSEAYGGYHWDALHGINLDVGLFLSYIGLFSYYNSENWAYQPSFTSSNTPWFFNGARLQVFPTDHFKFELWLINGWQAYGMYNEMPGVGYQVLWRPRGDLSFVSNGYTGQDTLVNASRQRYHTDTSLQYKYLDKPLAFLSKAALSITADLGCESGGGVRCINGDAKTPAQYFLSAMLYSRFWFHRNKFATTLGGGFINNPGRYLVLLPPIQNTIPGNNSGGQNAIVSTPYFTQNPGDEFRAWDASFTFDYMPDQFVTVRTEFNHRHANVGYFAGHAGVTSSNGLNTTAASAAFTPDLVQTENRINMALLVRF